MSDLIVHAAQRIVQHDNRDIPCLIGKNGVISAGDKREGDGKSPLGRWAIRSVLLRPDRIDPPPGLTLPWRWIRRDDGWSDGNDDPAYNRPVRHPHPFSAESLWRDDDAYDVIVILAHNDAPPRPAMGSAIFFHVASEGKTHTEGCIAIAKAAMLTLLPRLRPGDAVEIRV